MENNLPRALYSGKLPIGGLELDCYVLDDENNTRILSATAVFEAFDRPRKGMNSRLEIDGTKLPPFLASKALFPFINQELMRWTKQVEFLDGLQKKSGYNAEILPEMCSLYLKARRSNGLLSNQIKLAERAEILQEGFAKVGLIALIDEATGFQINRKSEALRQLLQTYLAEGIRKWIKEFPDDFFSELDRLYGNQNLKSSQRPAYYGKFINTYVYEPIENGKINPELQKRYKEDNKIHRKHQHFNDFGAQQLRIQIGRILGLMQVAPNIEWFKNKQKNLKQFSLFPED